MEQAEADKTLQEQLESMSKHAQATIQCSLTLMGIAVLLCSSGSPHYVEDVMV